MIIIKSQTTRALFANAGFPARRFRLDGFQKTFHHHFAECRPDRKPISIYSQRAEFHHRSHARVVGNVGNRVQAANLPAGAIPVSPLYEENRSMTLHPYPPRKARPTGSPIIRLGRRSPALVERGKKRRDPRTGLARQESLAVVRKSGSLGPEDAAESGNSDSRSPTRREAVEATRHNGNRPRMKRDDRRRFSRKWRRARTPSPRPRGKTQTSVIVRSTLGRPIDLTGSGLFFFRTFRGRRLCGMGPLRLPLGGNDLGVLFWRGCTGDLSHGRNRGRSMG